MDETTTQPLTDPAAGASTSEVAPTGTSVPAQTTPAQTPPEQVDLTSFPQFRALQSQMDRERDAQRAENRRLQQQLEEERRFRQQQERASIETLDPAEQAARWRAEATRLEQERIADQQAAAQREAFAANATRVNNKLREWNLTLQDPEVAALVAPHTQPTDAATLIVVDGIATIGRQRLLAQQAQQGEEAKRKAQAQANQALNDAGVTTTSSGAAASVVPKDDKAKLKKQFFEEWTRHRSQPNGNQYRALMERMRKVGMTPADLQS